MNLNYQLIIFIAFAVSGVAFLADVLYFKPQRKKNMQFILQQYEQELLAWQKDNLNMPVATTKEDVIKQYMAQPLWLELTAGLFPVICTVFILRSFIVEPFKIPSASMMPGLIAGDFIAVNKFEYGLRLPLINHKILDNNSPKRGDVIVFKYPLDTKIDYIKRVIGLPGDTITYHNKKLSINGQAVIYQKQNDFYVDEKDFGIQQSMPSKYVQQLIETLKVNETQTLSHTILNDASLPAYIEGAYDFNHQNLCNYTQEGVTCKVPQGNYFVMGDYRDNSSDSRYWGFVPEENIIGKAFFIWLNISDLSRVGNIK